MSIDLSPQELWTPPKPAIIRAAELQRSPAEARGIATRYRAHMLGMPGIVGLLGSRTRDPDLVFLSHLDGADGATSASDVALGGTGNPHTITFNGSAQLDDVQKVFGPTSLLPNGSNVSIADHADFDFGANDFTLAGWCRTTTLTDAWRFTFGKRANSSTQTSILIGQSGGSGGGAQLRCWVSSNGTTWDMLSESVMGSIAADTWHHWELVRSGSTFYKFVDGVLGGTATSSATVHNTTAAVRIGGDSDGFSWSGWIDEPALWNGRALHTASFTPPSAPYSPYL